MIDFYRFAVYLGFAGLACMAVLGVANSGGGHSHSGGHGHGHGDIGGHTLSGHGHAAQLVSKGGILDGQSEAKLALNGNTNGNANGA